MKEYIVEIDYKDSNNNDFFTIVRIPYKKAMSKEEIDALIKRRMFNYVIIQWKII